jgi:hypothetical protein
MLIIIYWRLRTKRKFTDPRQISRNVGSALSHDTQYVFTISIHRYVNNLTTHVRSQKKPHAAAVRIIIVRKILDYISSAIVSAGFKQNILSIIMSYVLNTSVIDRQLNIYAKMSLIPFITLFQFNI